MFRCDQKLEFIFSNEHFDNQSRKAHKASSHKSYLKHVQENQIFNPPTTKN